MHDTDLERMIYSHHAAAPVAEGETLFTTFADRVVRRVMDVISEKEKRRLSQTHAAFLAYMLGRVGIASAVPASDLCFRFSLNERELKQIVHDLRLKHRVQIGASRDGEAGGYYLISNEEESVESSQQMFHQAINMLRVVHVLRSKQTAAELAGQVRLALESSTESEVA